MIRTVIIEDEAGVRKVIKTLLNKLCPEVEVVGEGESVSSGLKVINDKSPDLVLLDIQIPGGNGFTILKQLEKIEFKTIFITAFDEYAIEAIKFSAMDYLLKPVNSVELSDAIKKYDDKQSYSEQVQYLLENLNTSTQKRKIAIPSTGKITYVNNEEIVRVQAEGSYTDIFLENGAVILSSKPIKEYEDLLNDKGFFRVHRSHLVNLKMVKEFVTKGKDYLVMTDKSRVEVSRNQRMAFKEAMNNI